MECIPCEIYDVPVGADICKRGFASKVLNASTCVASSLALLSWEAP